MQLLERIFHIKARGGNIKSEIIGGLVTFVSMCYILPVNAAILGDAGMNPQGVFMMTALLSFAVTWIMGLVANYPIVLSAGMGLNAFLSYTVCQSLGFSWQEAMVLLTIAGLLFFVLSLTPVRRIIIEAIPKDLKLIISAALGAFICFVGLKGSGIIASSPSTFVSLNSFVDPAVLIAILAVLLCFGLLFVPNKLVRGLAIPIAIAFSAIVGVIASEILIGTGCLQEVNGAWVYANFVEAINGQATLLPIFPTHMGAKFADFSGVSDVVFFGAFGSEPFNFGEALGKIFTNPASYIAIFSLVFVHLFDTTATLLAVGKDAGMMDAEGKMQNYQRAVLADATGALVCGPLGTSTLTSFAESNVGVSLGAKTGLAACVAGFMFLLSAFIYPVFSVFTAGSVTAPALVAVGAMIFANNLKEIEWKNPIVAFTAFLTIVFALLTYSIADGIGLGLIFYIVMMLFAGKAKEIRIPIYIIGGFFLLSYLLSSLLKILVS